MLQLQILPGHALGGLGQRLDLPGQILQLGLERFGLRVDLADAGAPLLHLGQNAAAAAVLLG